MTVPWDETTKCKDCGKTAGLKPGHMEVFYLHDELWNSFADTHDVLCFDCAQKRLGRPIALNDLKECFITRVMKLGIKIFEQTNKFTCPICGRSDISKENKVFLDCDCFDVLQGNPELELVQFKCPSGHKFYISNAEIDYKV